MKTLEETIQEAEAAMRERWRRSAQAAPPEPPWADRFREAKQIIRDRLPPFVQERTEALRKRCHPELLSAVDRWDWGSRSLVLCGPTRIGKTSAAAALVRRLVAKAAKDGGLNWELAKWIRWEHAATLATARKRHALGEQESPEVERAMRAPLLVLDDLGWDRDADVVEEVLDARYQRTVPTVVTSGRSPDELLERYGDAVYRRMFEAGGKGGAVWVKEARRK